MFINRNKEKVELKIPNDILHATTYLVSGNYRRKYFLHQSFFDKIFFSLRKEYLVKGMKTNDSISQLKTKVSKENMCIRFFAKVVVRMQAYSKHALSFW